MLFPRISILVLAVTITLAGKVPRALPDLTIPTPDGKKVRIQQYKGKVMTVVLFSTTCEECVASINLLSKAQKQFGPRGFQALAAAVNIDAPEQIRSFVERYR